MGISGDVKIGEPADVAGLISYLVKPESHFITGKLSIAFSNWDIELTSLPRKGQTISIDGGLVFD